MRYVNDLGDQFYFKDGTIDVLHREDGPAILWSYGYREWYWEGIHHRLDGPAVEYNDYKEWWINGVRLSTQKELIMKLWYENGRV